MDYFLCVFVKLEMTMENLALKKLLESGRSFTTAQAVSTGISRQALCDCLSAGKLVRLSRGVYLPISVNNSETPEIEALQRKGVDFVLCLLSALRFYDIGTQNPPGIWIAIPNSHHIPVMDFKVECIRLGEQYYNARINIQTLNGLQLKVYSPARTVADCFRFRNRIGLDVALEALRDGWQKKLFTSDELYDVAKECRIANVITPYMEMNMI